MLEDYAAVLHEFRLIQQSIKTLGRQVNKDEVVSEASTSSVLPCDANHAWQTEPMKALASKVRFIFDHRDPVAGGLGAMRLLF